MKLELDSFNEPFEKYFKRVVLKATREALLENKERHIPKEWLSLKEGAEYAGVSYNTFMKFRLLGLPVCEIDGIKRVSKKEIDSFLKKNSF